MRHALALVALLVVSACGGNPPPASNPITYWLGITVTDEGGQVTPGVAVSLQTPANPSGPSGRTDARGGVGFRLTAGEYDAWAQPDGYQRASAHVSLRSNVDLTLRLSRVPPPEPPKPVYTPRRGAPRVAGRAIVDDDGYWLARGTSLFWALWGHRYDHARLVANLEYLAKSGGVDYIRVLAQVGAPGDAWGDRIADPAWSDYDAQVRGLMDLASTYGLRVQWTLMGSAALYSPDQRSAFVERFARLLVGREHQVALVEIGNEPTLTGLADLGELRALASRVRAILPGVPLALGALWGEELRAYEGSRATVCTMHLERDSSKADGPWRPVRQPWGYPGEYPGALPAVASNNEPIGIASSVAKDADAERLVAGAAVAYVSGMAYSVIHTGAGIYGRAYDHSIGHREANLYDQPTMSAVLAGLRALKSLLPADLPNWTRQNAHSGFPERPWDVDRFWPDVGGDGLVRLYSATKDGKAVSVAIGVRGASALTARRPMTGTIYRVVDGTKVADYAVQQGQTVRLDGAVAGAFYLIEK